MESLECKIYCEEKSVDINNPKNKHLLNDERIQKLLRSGEKTLADLFIENDRPIYSEKVVEDIADFIKKNNLLGLK